MDLVFNVMVTEKDMKVIRKETFMVSWKIGIIFDSNKMLYDNINTTISGILKLLIILLEWHISMSEFKDYYKKHSWAYKSMQIDIITKQSSEIIRQAGMVFTYD